MCCFSYHLAGKRSTEKLQFRMAPWHSMMQSIMQPGNGWRAYRCLQTPQASILHKRALCTRKLQHALSAGGHELLEEDIDPSWPHFCSLFALLTPSFWLVPSHDRFAQRVAHVCCELGDHVEVVLHGQVVRASLTSPFTGTAPTSLYCLTPCQIYGQS